jgi:hypothetical protein
MAVELLTEIRIAAPPAQVWSVLTDFPRFPEWNSFLRITSGRAQAGARLVATIAAPGYRAARLAPHVLRADVNREFRWLGRVLVRGIFDAEHYFRIEPDGSGSRFQQGETFRGVLVPFVMRGKLLAATKSGFEEFNAALKRRAETTPRTE